MHGDPRQLIQTKQLAVMITAALLQGGLFVGLAHVLGLNASSVWSKISKQCIKEIGLSEQQL